MAQQGWSGAAFEKENVAKKWPQGNATWERGDRGWERPQLGGMPAELAFAAAASLSLSLSKSPVPLMALRWSLQGIKNWLKFRKFGKIYFVIDPQIAKISERGRIP